MDRPILLCGLGLVGWRVLEHLKSLDHPVVVVDNQAEPDDPRLQHPHVRLIQGDCRKREILEQADVHLARGVLILTSKDLINISCALGIRRLNSEVRIVIRMFNQNLVTRLGKMMPNTIALSVSALAAPRLARRALDCEELAEFTNVEGGQNHVTELILDEDSPLIGLTIREVFNRHGLQSVAHQCPEAEHRVLMNLDFHARLQVGDRLTVAGPPQAIAHARDPGRDDLFPPVLWAGKLRRLWRVVLRTLLEVDRSVKIAGAVLAFILLISTLIFHYWLQRGWADGLYRTISAMATMTDLRGDDYKDVDYPKAAMVFVSFMRIMGAIMLAAFTAIFTNFLLRARLGGALEIRKIPDSGHVVVIGLGNVGFRLVEHLLDVGERVVVVESDESSNFVATCRRFGVPVLIGDGTVPEVLVQARVQSAKAVIAVTSNELANLEVALMVPDLAPDKRVVVRLSDPMLAETMAAAETMPLAVSLPALAAPAFMAGLFEDRVQAVFRLGEQDMVVVDLKVKAEDTTLVGQSLQTIAIDYNLIPIGLSGLDPNASRDTSNYRLQPGDQLTVFTTPMDLGRLIQRKPVPQNWGIEVRGYPIGMREDLAVRVRLARGIPAEQASALMQQTPFRFAEHMTRGQAEEWLRLLLRERIDAELVEVRSSEPAAKASEESNHNSNLQRRQDGCLPPEHTPKATMPE